MTQPFCRQWLVNLASYRVKSIDLSDTPWMAWLSRGGDGFGSLNFDLRGNGEEATCSDLARPLLKTYEAQVKDQ